MVKSFINILGSYANNMCDVERILLALKAFFAHNKFVVKNLIEIDTGNTSVMVAMNNGVYAEIKKYVPSLILINCACHSLLLAMSNAASECLPRSFHIAENYNWFSNYSIRQQNLYKAINDHSTSLKIPAQSQTKWLSIRIAQEMIVNPWLELKLHFHVTRQTWKWYFSEILYAMYIVEVNLEFLLFSNPILKLA